MAASFANDFWFEESDSNGQVIDSNYDAFYPRAYNMGGGTSISTCWSAIGIF